MEINPVFSNTCILKIAEGLGQILVARHTLLDLIDMISHLNKQSGSNQEKLYLNHLKACPYIPV